MELDSFNIRQTRGAFDVLGDTFKYIRIYWKSLLKMTAVYVLGPLMIGSLFLASGFGDLFNGTFFNPDAMAESIALESGLLLFGAFFFIAISYMLFYGTICQHLKHAGKGEIPMDISKFGSGMFIKLIQLILIFVLLSFLFFLAVMVFSVLIMQFPGEVIVASFFVLGFAIIYVYIRLILFPVALFVKGTSGLNSLAVSWRLTSGYFWQTVGVYLLITIIFGILSQLVSTPLLLINTILRAGFGESAGGIMEVLSVTFLTLSFVFQGLFFGAQSIAIGLHYFNLEERKVAHTLGNQIDQLAQGT